MDLGVGINGEVEVDVDIGVWRGGWFAWVLGGGVGGIVRHPTPYLTQHHVIPILITEVVF